MTPRSHVLITHGEKIECSSLYPTKYRLDNVWYSLAPQLVASTNPKEFTSKLKASTWKYKTLSIGMSGIYSYEDIERQRSAILFTVEHNAIAKTITSNAGGYQTGSRDLNLMGLINPVDLQNALEDYWQTLDSNLQVIGSYSGLVLMIIAVYKMLTAMLGGGIHCVMLHKLFGWLGGCFGLLCPVASNVALILGQEEIRRTGNAQATVPGIIREFRRQNRPMMARPRDTDLYPLRDIQVLQGEQEVE